MANGGIGPEQALPIVCCEIENPEMNVLLLYDS